MEHIDLINKIIEAEQRARRLSEETLEKRETMQKRLEETTVSMRDEYFKRAKARLEKVKAKENALADEQIAELDRVFDSDMENIETAFAEHSGEWADKLFRMIVD